MAANDEAKTGEPLGESFGGRRLAIGLNVSLSVLLAIGLTVLVNWFASMKHVHADVASFGSYSLSQRTRNIIAGLKGPVKITTAYLSRDPDTDRSRFIDRMVSYGEELQLANEAKISVKHISRDDEKAALVRSIADTYGSESGEHQKVVTEFAAVKKELDTALGFGGAGMDSVAAGESWLTNFPIYGSIIAAFREQRTALDTVNSEVARLVTGSLPKYGDATSKISQSLKPIKDQLTKAQMAMTELAKLAEEAKKPDSDLAKSLQDVITKIRAVPPPLLKAAGVDDKEAPADPKSALQSLATAMQKGDETLRRLAVTLDELGRKYPAVETHPDWRVATSMGLGNLMAEVEIGQVLSSMGTSLRQNRQTILDFLDRNNAENIAKALDANRTRVIPQVAQNLSLVADKLAHVLADLGKVDAESARILQQARGGGLFDKPISSVTKLLERIDKLPPLKLGQIAEDLRRDNIVVIEDTASKQARVLGFDEVWPVREQLGGGPQAANEVRLRTFNGDAAIGGAILALTSEKPFATVIFGTFEIEPPQQMRQMMQPQQSSIPGDSLAKFKARLRGANFHVKEWDLSKAAPAPAPDAGTEAVYIFTPPAPPNPQNPFMGGQNPSRTFGDAERRRVAEVLDKGGRAIFLCCWEWRPGGMMGGFSTPEYGYDKLLQTDWGIDVDNGKRVVEVIPDVKRPGHFALSGELFNYMGLTQFSDHPMGRPFKNSRLYVFDACPLEKLAKVPDGVDVQPVLTVPLAEQFVAADVQEVIRWVNALQNPDSDQGSIERGDNLMSGPFPVVLAATRKKGDKESRVVVMGTGRSLWDRYMGEPMQRTASGGRMYSDPPPSNNADFVINGLHWLRGEEKWIAAGPVSAPTITAIDTDQRRVLMVMLCGVLPLLVAGLGGMMWWMRQR